MILHPPNFIIHAAGSLGNMPDLGKKAYRLKFCVTGHARMTAEQLRRGLNACLDDMERQLKAQGFRFAGEDTIQFVRKQPHIEPMTIRPQRPPSSREMEYAVRQGAKFRAPLHDTLAQNVPLLMESDAWDYLFSALFVHETILTDKPDLHEERRPR